MDVETGGSDHTRTLRRAHERRDVELALGLYDERARVRLVGRGAPPHAPDVFVGKERIAEYLREAYLGGWSPRVGYALNEVVAGDGRVVLNVAYFDAGGARVLLASETYMVSGGRIVDQLNIEARRGRGGPPPEARLSMMEKRQANTGFPETASRGEAVRQEPRAPDRLPLSIGRTYGRFLELPPALVLLVMWVAGAALLGSIGLVLYWTVWVLVRLAAGFV